MKKHFNLLFILIFLPLVMLANDNYPAKSWDDGLLTWNDFKGTSIIANSPSYIKANLSIDTKDEIVNKKQQTKLYAKAVMYPGLSYADNESRTEQRLRYHQLQFDQLELCRRRLQQDLNSGMNGIESDNKLKYYQNYYHDRMKTIADETKNGQDDHKLQEWEYYTRKALDEIGLPPVPEIVPNDWSYGIYLGVGYLFPTSNITDDFGNSFTFTAGLTGGYKRIKLKADISYGQPKILEKNIFGVRDGKQRNIQESINNYASFLGISASLGYTVFDSKRFAVTPHAGFYWSNYGWTTGDLEWEKDQDGKDVAKITSTTDQNLKDFSWMAGIDFDIKFHSHVSNSPLFFTGHREQITSSVRITPYVFRGCYDKALPSLKGYQIGVTVSYAGILNALKLK